MHEKSIFWVYLYSKYGKKHIDENVRVALDTLIPHDENLEERMVLLKKLNIDDQYLAEFTKKKNLLDFAREFFFKLRTFGYYSYTRQDKQKIADSYIHPQSIKYNAKMLKELFNKSDLELFDFRVQPDLFGIGNNKYLLNILNLQKKDIYERLHIYSSLLLQQTII